MPFAARGGVCRGVASARGWCQVVVCAWEALPLNKGTHKDKARATSTDARDARCNARQFTRAREATANGGTAIAKDRLCQAAKRAANSSCSKTLKTQARVSAAFLAAACALTENLALSGMRKSMALTDDERWRK
jgi:hypothetical protein